MTSTSPDGVAIDAVVDEFFAAFASGADAADRIAVLRELMLPGALIVRAGDSQPVTYNVDGFIAPRVELLGSGELQDFREWTTERRTDLFGDIAQVWCSYAKAWTQSGTQQHGRGMKSLHLVRTGAGWRISAVIWDDERPAPGAAPG